MFARQLVIVIGLALACLSQSPIVFADTGSSRPGYMPPRIFKRPLTPAEFSLMTHHGDAFTPQSLKGAWTLAFFGYTSCADVCPVTLSALKSAARKLREDTQLPQVREVFISVDPFRDTTEVLREHIEFFDPSFTGVTGDVPELLRFAWAFAAPFEYRDKQTGKRIGNGTARPEGDDYLVGHMVELFVFNPEGNLAGLIFKPDDPDRIVADLKLFFEP